MFLKRSHFGGDARLVAALAVLWFSLAPTPGKAGSDSLLCGFLVGFGGYETTIFNLTLQPSAEQAAARARQERKALQHTFARFLKWYPNMAQSIQPYVQSRDAVFSALETGEQRTAARI